MVEGTLAQVDLVRGHDELPAGRIVVRVTTDVVHDQPAQHVRRVQLYTRRHATINELPAHTQVSRYQKGKTNLDFTEGRDSEWQWHQLGQVCTLLQTDNHASTPPLSFYRPDALPAAQPTASKHWRQSC